jgi:SAM-dependent methyltransferase
VIATDPSHAQLAEAPPTRGAHYAAALAEAAPLADRSVDLILAAQAAHWFDQQAFHREVRRIARDGAILALVTYGPFTAAGDLGRALEAFYHGPIHAHWPAERAHVEAGYRTLPFPFAEIEAPAFAMRARWPFERLVGYIDSWSAMKGWRAALGRDPLSEVAAELATVWGPREGRREIRWPLSLRVGRIR